MIFKRKIYDKMLEWKRSKNGETALLIKGARRIGKSTIVEEFAKNEYETYILIDFSDVPAAALEAIDNIADKNNFFFQFGNLLFLSVNYLCDNIQDGIAF